MAEVYKIMQSSNATQGYRRGDRVYVGYYNARGEYVESQRKTNQSNGRRIRTRGLSATVRNAGNRTLNNNGNIISQARRLNRR